MDSTPTSTTFFPWKQFIVFILVALIVSSFFHFFYHNIADPDSFYHARQAQVYLSHPFDSSNTWMKYTAFAREGGDMWYGFHLFLAPFVAGNIDTGIRVAGVAITTFFLVCLWWITRRFNAPYPWLWPFIAFFILPNAMYFFVMVRPHMFSLIFGLLLTAFFVRGKLWQIGLASLAITFFHGSFFWLPFFIAGAYSCANIFIHKRNKITIGWHLLLQKIVWVIVGTLIGLALHPNPIGATKIAWVQIVDLVRLGLAHVPIVSGTEMLPLGVMVFSTATIMLIWWMTTIFFAGKTLWKKEGAETETKTFLGITTLLSIIFGLLAIFVAMRFFVLWIAFAVLAGSMLARHTKQKPLYTKFAVAALVIVLIPYALYRHNLNERYVATNPEKFELAGLWLREHSKPGELVFNTHWDQFGPLIHHDTSNTYVGGMHSIFQYAYSPSLYWKYHYITTDIAGEVTCPAFPCTKEQVVETYGTLKNDFAARLIFVEPDRNPYFTDYLRKDPRYTSVYKDKESEIFEVR